jgi:ATP-dependent Clp protease adapter protein ClpS
MTTIEIDKVRQRQNQEHDAPKLPQQYVIILHVNPDTKNMMIVLAITHVLVDHLGFPRSDVLPIVMAALRSGRRVVKSVTKDVGETMMDQIHECGVAANSSDYKFSLEPA